MNSINMANMNAMTGHVHDASLTMMNSCAVAPHGAPRQLKENYNKQTQLNTYIYEYFLRYGMFDCAQAILKADSDVNVQRHSPRSPRDDKRCRLRNTLSDESIDIGLDSKLSGLLPDPNVPNLSLESCFLYEWFCLFWDMFNAQKNECGRSEQQNKLRSNASWSQTQGSSVIPHAPDWTIHNAFYNPGEMGVGYMTPGTSGGQAGGRRKRTLQEFQVQLASMEQQNKRDLIARQDTTGLPRNDGVPGGRGGRGPPEGPQLFQRSALQGAGPGPLPNDTNQMKLGTQQMNDNGMGSHLPENFRSCRYPNSINFLANQINPDIEPHVSKAGIGGIGGNMAVVQRNGWTRPFISHPSQQLMGRTFRQPVAATEAQFQHQEKTGQIGPVQWQDDPNENQIPQAAQRGVQGTPQQPSRRQLFTPANANASAKSRSIIPSPPQTSNAAPSIPQFSKSTPRKGTVSKGTTPKKGTKNVKNEAVTQKIRKSNPSSGATPAAKTVPVSVPHVNPVDIRKEAQDTSLGQVVPTGQPVAPLSLAPAPMVAPPPVDLAQNVAFSMDEANMIDFASLPTFDDDLDGFDFDSILENSAEGPGGFYFDHVPFDINAGDIDGS